MKNFGEYIYHGLKDCHSVYEFMYDLLESNQLPDVICDMKKIKQKNNKSVFLHTLDVISCLEIKNRTTVFSALFHDVSKKPDINICHQYESSIISKKVLHEWGVYEDIIRDVQKIIHTHMTDIKNQTDKGIGRFIKRVGVNNLNNWFILRRADSISYHSKSLHIIENFREQINKFVKENKSVFTPECQNSLRIDGYNNYGKKNL